MSNQEDILAVCNTLQKRGDIRRNQNGDLIYTRTDVDNPRNMPLWSSQLARLVITVAVEDPKFVPSPGQIQRIVSILEAQSDDADNCQTGMRVAGANDSIYICRHDEGSHVVEITKDDIREITEVDCPVDFLKPEGVLPLPSPDLDGSLSELRELFPNLSETDADIAYGCLIQSATPEAQYPILNITGVRGSGKTTLARVMNDIIDPTTANTSEVLGSASDIAVLAIHNHILVFDVDEPISAQTSRHLVQLATEGGTFTLGGSRIHGTRPIILTSSEDQIDDPSLLDRTVQIYLNELDDSQVLPRAEVLARVSARSSALLGGLCLCLQETLKHSDIRPAHSSRLASFDKTIASVSQDTDVAPWGSRDLGGAYRSRMKIASEDLVSGDQLLHSIRQYLAEKDELGNGIFVGTASELLTALGEANCRKIGIKAPNILSRRLGKIRRDLARCGIVFDNTERTAGARRIELKLQEPQDNDTDQGADDEEVPEENQVS